MTNSRKVWYNKVMAIKLKDDIDIAPGSGGLWYNITVGGYFSPEDVMSDAAQILEMRAAIELVSQLESVYDEYVPEY